MRSSISSGRRPATAFTPLFLLLCLSTQSSCMVSAFVTRHSSTAGVSQQSICEQYNDLASSELGISRRQSQQSNAITIMSASKATSAASEAREKPSIKGKLATAEEIIQYGEDVGVKISLSTLGPGYRAVARAAHDEEQIIGYVEGFLRPAGKILHLDKMEVWKKAVDRARKENPDGYKNGGNVFGVGLLLGYLCLLHGLENGCKEAEFLAIDDEEYQHKRLVRYYRNSGFKVIKYVGEDVRDIPDRLVWGGCGTLMREEVMVLLEKWTKFLFQSEE